MRKALAASPYDSLAWVPGNVYFDNFRVNSVPEPVSMGLFGLGSLALLRRRRA